jgi:hypothetical protein
MHNVAYETKDGKLIVIIDVSKRAVDAAPPSSSGKTSLVATTGGAMPIPSPNGVAISFSLNVMAKKP